MVPDLMMALLRSRPMMLAPITGITLPLFVYGMVAGMRRIRQLQPQIAGNQPNPANVEAALNQPPFSWLGALMQALLGSVYMLHWLPIVSSMTARIAVRPKRLKWVKTVHHGTDSVVDVQAAGE